MSIDLSEFHDIFFEECTEGLSVMENGLLSLDNGTDVEEINSIFRAAHSIKGGAGSFGFNSISEFTHVMETLLDEMRDGRREVTRGIVDLLLESVDVLRDMVSAARDEEDSDDQRTAEVKSRLEKVLSGEQETPVEKESADVQPTIEDAPVVESQKNDTAEIAENSEPANPENNQTPEAEASPAIPESNQNPKASSAVPAKPEVKKSAKSKSSGSKEGGSIRVGIDKVDALINMVGELVITQSMLSQISSNLQESQSGSIEKLVDGITQLERNTRELQESVLQIRMLPISFSFSRFPRLVRDLSKNMGKNIELKMTGEHTEVDKNVLEKIGDPLVHLVRNSLDHGIETPDIRASKGKPVVGILELCAYHEGGDIIIKVIDDGAGLNRDRILSKALDKGLVNENEELTDERIFNLIFMPGFSTADQISDVSGRGVGMDVVRRNVRDLGGNVTINNNTNGAGSTVTIRLPLTLAILDGQLVRIGNETYIVSLVSIVESLQMKAEVVSSITGQSELYRLRDEYIPIIRVNRLFGATAGTDNLLEGLLVVVESDGQRVGLFVDDLLGQQQVVIKSLETNFKQIQGISGATILGDGTVALIMDVPGLVQRHFDECKNGSGYPVAA